MVENYPEILDLIIKERQQVFESDLIMFRLHFEHLL